jgi:hypothetical protein
VDRRQAVGRRDPLLAKGGVVLCRQSMVGESSFEKSVRIVVYFAHFFPAPCETPSPAGLLIHGG